MSVARIYRVASPFNGSELADTDFEQSADTMYFAHLNHVPHKLVRTAHTDWTFSDVTFAPTVPTPTSVSAVATTPNTDAANSGNAYFPQTNKYVVTAINDTTGQESRASTSSSATSDLTLKRNYITITWAASAGATRYNVYKAQTTGDFGYIGNTSALTFRDDNIGPDYSEGPPSAQNPFSGTGNYPSTVTFFEQRLMYGRTSNKPNAIYGSRSGDFENMDTSRPLRSSDALSFSLVSGRVNAVNQLAAVNNLFALTSDSIFKIDSGSQGFITPTDFISRRQNGRGSSRLSPLVIDSIVFYKTSVGNGIRTLGYQFQSDSTESNDITVFSPHFFRDFNIVSWAYAQEPRSIIWAVRDDGKLLCFTWEQEQQVWGWTLCETNGLVETVCVISENGEDRLYLTVRRNNKLLIERMASSSWDAIDDCCFMDSAVTYSETVPFTVLTNLDHLEGQTVIALAGGNVVDGLVVTNGQVTLPTAVTRATVGLPFRALVETMPLSTQTKTGGWTTSKPKTASRAVVRVIESRGLKIGPSDDKLETVRNRQYEALGAVNSLRSGLVETTLQANVSNECTVVVASDDPLPMTITGIFYDPSISD